MKPTIPDAGTVIRLEGDNAVIRMKYEGSCRKCGAAAIGLCKGSFLKELTVKNSRQARVGDTVKIGLVQGTQFEGYILAYVVPSVALVLGTVAGHFLGTYTGFQPLDIITGFFSMIATTFFSLRRLKRLDASSSIEIVNVFYDPRKPASQAVKSDADTIRDYFMSSF